MLACDDLDQRFQASTSSSSSGNKAQAKTTTSNAVPLLSLTSNDKNKQNGTHSSNNKQQAKMIGSSGFLSSTTEHSQHFRDEAKKPSSHRQHQQQHSGLDSPGSRVTTSRSTSRSTNGSSSGSSSSSGYVLAHGDATEFVLSIQEYLTMDRIAMVLDDVKGTTTTNAYILSKHFLSKHLPNFTPEYHNDQHIHPLETPPH